MKRRVAEGEVHHIYQKTKGGVVIFYSLRDYLVYFTIFCTLAERMDVTVLALCPMPDHLHSACRFLAILSPDKKEGIALAGSQVQSRW